MAWQHPGAQADTDEVWAGHGAACDGWDVMRGAQSGEGRRVCSFAWLCCLTQGLFKTQYPIMGREECMENQGLGLPWLRCMCRDIHGLSILPREEKGPSFILIIPKLGCD